MSGAMIPEPAAAASLSDFVAEVVRTQDKSLSLQDERYLSFRAGLQPGIAEGGPGDVFGRLFSTKVGTLLHDQIGNEGRTAGTMGLFAVEVLSEAITLNAPPLLRTALTWAAKYIRQMAVFGGSLNTDLLILLPESFAPDEPQVLLSADHLDPGLIDKALEQLGSRVESLPPDSSLRALYAMGQDEVLQALWIARPKVILARAPVMERTCVPLEAIAVAKGEEKSTAGIFARDGAGKLGITVAFHATGDRGTQIEVAGRPATIAGGSQIFDTSFALLPEDFAIPPLRGLKGPMLRRAPSRGETMRFYGAASKEVETSIEGVDLGIPGVDPGRMRCVQTTRDTNPGDSGAALVNSDDEVVGLAYQRSKFNDRPAFADWVWAKSVYDVLGLQPLKGETP
jgi:hypothetical protein